jgi:hypothetical protein
LTVTTISEVLAKKYNHGQITTKRANHFRLNAQVI